MNRYLVVGQTGLKYEQNFQLGWLGLMSDRGN